MQNGLLAKNKNYRMIWLAGSTSKLGDWFNQVALSLITLSMTNSALSMGFVLLCRSLPGVLLSPLLSPLVDKYSKRIIMYTCDLFRAVFALFFAFAYITNSVSLLFIGAILLGLSGMMFNPAQQASIPLLVAHKDLPNAYALNSSMSGIISVVGALFGGVVSSIVSPIVCFLINSFSYMISAFFIYLAKWEEERITYEKKETYADALKVGFHEVKRNDYVRSIILIGISWGFAGGAYYIVVPLLGKSIYQMGGLGIGLLYSIDGLGIILGAIIVKKFIGTNRKRVNLAYGVAYVTQAIFFTLLTQFSSIFTGIMMILFMRISSGIIIPLDSFILQKHTRPTIRARVFSIHDSTYSGFMQLSYIVFGFLFEKLGISSVGLFAGSISLLCGFSWLLKLGKNNDL